jgi:MFS family permease
VPTADHPILGVAGRLEHDERTKLALLGVPTFALALSVTTVTAYLPVLSRRFVDSNLVIGVLLAMQGLLALWLPLLAGVASDRIRTRIGGRLPLLLAAAPVGAIALVAMGLVRSLWAMIPVATVFFAAYFIAYEPYRALYPDLVKEEVAGRSQSSQAIWRGAGTGLALIGGGLLFSIGAALPFVLAALILVLGIAGFSRAVVRRGVPLRPAPERTPREAFFHLFELLRESRALRNFLAANALWELSLAALQTFVVLYVSQGLGYGTGVAALFIGAAALVVLVGAALSGPLGDRMGNPVLLAMTLPFYGLGLLVPLLGTEVWLLVPACVLVGLGGGVVMSLPYAVLIPLMPESDHGSVTGLYSASRGVGISLGPLLAGLAVSALSGVFAGTQGYTAMWLVCGLAILLSLWPLHRMRQALADAH